MLQPLCKDTVLGSVAEPEPIFLMAGAESWSGSGCIFWQAEKESLVLVSKHDLRAIYTSKCDPKRLGLLINFLRAQNEKF